MKLFCVFAAFFLIFGCAATRSFEPTRAQIANKSAVHPELVSLPDPAQPIFAAVYKFRDETGQYKTSPTGSASSFSTAISQGATSMLVKAIEDSRWFVPVEREGLPNLLNERQIIRSTRMQFGEEQNLPPLFYAGVILEGGIVAYDTDIVTGGFGLKYFGAGGFTQLRRDQVTVYLRAVSVSNGRVLKSVSTTKQILSKEVSFGVYRFVRFKRLLEIETGITTNEPPQMCVLEAIEKAVLDLIIEGIKEGLWALSDPQDINHPVIQNYLKEKKESENIIQLNRKGQVVSGIGIFPRKRPISFGLSFDTQKYIGDYKKSELSPSFGGSVRYSLSPSFSASLDLNSGQLRNKEDFETNLISIEGRGIASLVPESKFNPFVFLGLGVINFWVQDKEGNSIPISRNYWGWKPMVIAGVGCEFLVSENFGVHSSFSSHYTFTDLLDGLVKGRSKDHFYRIGGGVSYYLR